MNFHGTEVREKALTLLWTHCTRNGNPYNISVAQKASVALMDTHLGPKY